MKNLNDIINPDSAGIWIDCGHHSSDTLSYRIIQLAHEHGYDVAWEQVESDMSNYDNLTFEEQANISESLWEESSLAIDWLNSQLTDERFYFYVDDNSLYLDFDDMEGAEYNV